MQRPGDFVRARIAGALHGWARAAEVGAFIEAVVWQVTHATGAPAGAGLDQLEQATVTDVVGLVQAAAGGEAAAAAAAEQLAANPPLLAAFFQNLDLLPAAPDPQVDAVALVVGAAVQRLAERLEDGAQP